VLAFAGQAVADDRALPRIVAATEPGSTVEVEVFRRGQAVTLEVTIERLEESGAPRRPAGASGSGDQGGDAAPDAALFGLTLEPLTDALRRRYRVHPDADGLVVTAVDPDSDAAGKVRVGDVVEEIAWTGVEDVDQARGLAEAAGEDGSPVLFSLNRQGQYVLQTLRADAS
jgi:serine protease Do